VSSQDRTPPATTSLTYAAGATAFNQVTVKLSSTGTFTIFNDGGRRRQLGLLACEPAPDQFCNDCGRTLQRPALV
jgi:hypothetical protein